MGKWPNQQCRSIEGRSAPKNQASIPPGPPHHVTIQHTINTKYTYTKMNLRTIKWAHWNKTQSRDLLNHHNRCTAFFPGPPGWAGARTEFLDFMVQEKINRGRHTDHPTGCHSIRTNQCPPPPSPNFLQTGCPSCRPTNSVKALKATSGFGLGRRR